MIYIVGVAGGSGSGKSTFAKKVTRMVDHSEVIHINQDWYYLPEPPVEDYVSGKPNFDHPSSFDWNLLFSQLDDLKQGKSIEAPMYDFKNNNRMQETQKIGPCKVALLEGIYALWDEKIRSIYDLKVFLHVDADIRFIRRLHRDVHERGRTLDSIINQYYDTVRPMHRQFLEPTSQFADILVGEETDIAASVIAAKIKAVVNG